MSYTRGMDTKRRMAVFDRDGGKCQLCSLDIRELASQLFPRHDKTEARSRALAACPWAHKAFCIGDLWDLDHITPVINGGGQKGDNNLRVLCKGCHRKVTKDLAGQRKRMPSKRILFRQ